MRLRRPTQEVIEAANVGGVKNRLSFVLPDPFQDQRAAWQRPRHLPPLPDEPHHCQKADAIIDQYLAVGLIQQSTSPYSSPMVAISKKGVNTVYGTVWYGKTHSM